MLPLKNAFIEVTMATDDSEISIQPDQSYCHWRMLNRCFDGLDIAMAAEEIQRLRIQNIKHVFEEGFISKELNLIATVNQST